SASWSFTVTAGTGCSWTAASTYSWIHPSGTGGSGPGTVNYSVDADTASGSRMGTITVAGQTFTITQIGVPCTYALSSSSASFNSAGGTGSVSMTAPGGCGWTATTASTWIHTTSS